MGKASKEHFEVFKTECEKWVKIFGLTDWYYHYIYNEDADSDNLADCTWDYASRQVVINLYDDWGDISEPTNESMREAAFHEICHILIARFQDLAYLPNPPEDEITSVGHAVINILQKVLCPIYDKPDCSGKCEKTT